MFTIQRKTFSVNEPETVFNNKGRTFKCSQYKEKRSVSMNQRRYSITKGEPTSVHNTEKNVQYQ